MAAHNELGKWGEDTAADYLQRNGYTIVERDWKSGHRDLDIITTSSIATSTATPDWTSSPLSAPSEKNRK